MEWTFSASIRWHKESVGIIAPVWLWTQSSRVQLGVSKKTKTEQMICAKSGLALILLLVDLFGLFVNLREWGTFKKWKERELLFWGQMCRRKTLMPTGKTKVLVLMMCHKAPNRKEISQNPAVWVSNPTLSSCCYQIPVGRVDGHFPNNHLKQSPLMAS